MKDQGVSSTSMPLLIRDIPMKSVREYLIQLIGRFSDDDTGFLKEVDRLIKSAGNDVYPVLLNLFTQLEFSEGEAKMVWEDILRHHYKLNSLVGRQVKLLTSLCDYLLSVKKSFKNPTVVELKLFEEANHHSKCDPMTGLFNRNYFTEALSSEISRSKRQQTEFSLIFLDLDNFKKVNDQYGHLTGDTVLTRISRLIQKEKRAEDTAARFGGEEMIVLLPGTNKMNALVKADRIREKIEEQEFEYEGHRFRVTVSGGVASYPLDAQSGQELIECSDKAMYRAKAGGKNRIELYSQDKRQYMRIDFSGPIKVQPLGHRTTSLNQFKVQSKDLSLTGMLFESNENLELGTRIQLSVPLDNPKRPMIVIGTVIRLEKIDSFKYDVGISFVQMELDERNEIHNFFAKSQPAGLPQFNKAQSG